MDCVVPHGNCTVHTYVPHGLINGETHTDMDTNLAWPSVWVLVLTKQPVIPVLYVCLLLLDFNKTNSTKVKSGMKCNLQICFFFAIS